MQVGDLMPADLVRLQNDAYLSIYALSSRWRSMYKKQGFFGVLLTASRFTRSLMEKRWPDFIRDRDLYISREQKVKIKECNDLREKVKLKIAPYGSLNGRELETVVETEVKKSEPNKETVALNVMRDNQHNHEPHPYSSGEEFHSYIHNA